MNKKKLLLIGASTGGPGHIEKILLSLPQNFSACVVIAQHIDKVFLDSMVKHLKNRTNLQISTAVTNRCLLSSNIVFVHSHLVSITKKDQSLYLKSIESNSFYNPSIDELFLSVVNLSREYEILACLLTGIGDDGAKGLLALKKSSVHCIAESQKSSIVYGMPKAAYDIGATDEVLDIDEIVEKIKKFVV